MHKFIRESRIDFLLKRSGMQTLLAYIVSYCALLDSFESTQSQLFSLPLFLWNDNKPEWKKDAGTELEDVTIPVRVLHVALPVHAPDFRQTHRCCYKCTVTNSDINYTF